MEKLEVRTVCKRPSVRRASAQQLIRTEIWSCSERAHDTSLFFSRWRRVVCASLVATGPNRHWYVGYTSWQWMAFITRSFMSLVQAHIISYWAGGYPWSCSHNAFGALCQTLRPQAGLTSYALCLPRPLSPYTRPRHSPSTARKHGIWGIRLGGASRHYDSMSLSQQSHNAHTPLFPLASLLSTCAADRPGFGVKQKAMFLSLSPQPRALNGQCL